MRLHHDQNAPADRLPLILRSARLQRDRDVCRQQSVARVRRDPAATA